jgi:hypothetical protein
MTTEAQRSRRRAERLALLFVLAVFVCGVAVGVAIA